MNSWLNPQKTHVFHSPTKLQFSLPRKWPSTTHHENLPVQYPPCHFCWGNKAIPAGIGGIPLGSHDRRVLLKPCCCCCCRLRPGGSPEGLTAEVSMEGTEGTPAVQRRQVSTIQRAAASLSSWESTEPYIIPDTNCPRNKAICEASSWKYGSPVVCSNETTYQNLYEREIQYQIIICMILIQYSMQMYEIHVEFRI